MILRDPRYADFGCKSLSHGQWEIKRPRQMLRSHRIRHGPSRIGGVPIAATLEKPITEPSYGVGETYRSCGRGQRGYPGRVGTFSARKRLPYFRSFRWETSRSACTRGPSRSYSDGFE